MLLFILLLGIGLVFLIAFRNWIRFSRFYKKNILKTIHEISHLIALKEWEEAKKRLYPLLNKGIGGKEVLLLYAQVLRGTKKYERALHTLIDASTYYPEELLFRQEEAKVLLEMGHPIEALEAFKVCAPILRSESDLVDVASAYYHAGFYDYALEILDSFQNSSENPFLFSLKGDCLFQLKKFIPALDAYLLAFEKGWESHHTLTNLGHTYRIIGHIDQAELLFRKILEKDSGDVEATLGLGACIEKRGFYQKALLIYQSGKAWEKNDPRILKQAAVCALFSKKYRYAEKYLLQLVREVGSSPELSSYYGYCLEQQNKWEEAEEHYLNHIQQFPNDAKGYRALAWMFGVGLSTHLTIEQGIYFAHMSLQLQPDLFSWEIVSACEARLGNFLKAHQIQENLLKGDNDRDSRYRRSKVMRILRKQLPLTHEHIDRTMVA